MPRFQPLVVVVILVQIAGVLLFLSGFLLTRSVVPIVSSCAGDGCVPGQFDRAIVVVIDALRFDFISYDDTQTAGRPAYINKFKHVKRMLEMENKALLLRSLSDPPTTTAQRLRALIGGSFPTMLDIGRSFNTNAIEEDNLLLQLKRSGKNATFLGDDTWMGLCPDCFARSFPFPSFNVRDLHGVDQGIKQQLPSELERTDWSLLVAHFLGVDHCGHIYGPDNTIMAAKLEEMDDVIRAITATMDNSTLLVVVGDHGMTEEGDHGGESHNEVSTAMLFYSPRGLGVTHSTPSAAVSQIDFVPTLALLLGLPVPFGSLGVPILTLFTDPPAGWTGWRTAYQNSIAETCARQMLRFVDAAGLADIFENNGNDGRLRRTAERMRAGALMDAREYVEFMERTRSALRLRWATFDEPRMVAGIAILLAGTMAAFGAGVARSSWLPQRALLPALVAAALFVSIAVTSLSDNLTISTDKVSWLASLASLAILACTRRWPRQHPAPFSFVVCMTLIAPFVFHVARSDTPSNLDWRISLGQQSLLPVLAVLSLFSAFMYASRRSLAGPQFAFRACMAATLLLYWRDERSLDAIDDAADPRILYPRLIFLFCCIEALHNYMTSSLSWHSTLPWLLPFILVVSDSSAAPAIIIEVLLLFVLRACSEKADSVDTIILFVFAHHSFYCCGHQNEFTTVRWSRGLVGLTQPWLPLCGALVTVDLFAAIILASVYCVLEQRSLGRSLCWLGLFAGHCLIAMVAAFVLRRHLMLWRVFGPRLLFDCAGLIVVQALVFLSSLRGWCASPAHLPSTSKKNRQL